MYIMLTLLNKLYVLNHKYLGYIERIECLKKNHVHYELNELCVLNIEFLFIPLVILNELCVLNT